MGVVFCVFPVNKKRETNGKAIASIYSIFTYIRLIFLGFHVPKYTKMAHLKLEIFRQGSGGHKAKGGRGGGPREDPTKTASCFFSSKNQSHRIHVSVSKNRGTPKWMVYNGKPN